MLALLQVMHPELTPGDHYVLAWAVPNEGMQSQEHAYIYFWNAAGVPQPTQEELVAYWAVNQPAILAWAVSDAIRAERNKRLAEADQLVERAIDKGDTEADKTARTYRQALRDLPQQPGFPDSFEWPVAPL